MLRYLITGVTGYIGSMLVKQLINQNKDVTVVVRNSEKAREMLPEQTKILCADLLNHQKVLTIPRDYDYIIHCASITKSIEMIERPLEVIQSIVNTTQNILDFAVQCRVKSVVYISSMEVYGKWDCAEGYRCVEDDAGAGIIDICNARSCYPLAKRMAENICYCYYKQYGLPIKIVRLAQIFGKGVLAGENRVFAQFARSAIEKKDIVLHTDGMSIGNYCDITDAVNGILTVLEKGATGEVYNVVNEECTMTIRQMAELVATDLAKGEISVVIDIPKENIYGYAANTGVRLSSQKLRQLGWMSHKDMRAMYIDLIEDMKKMESKK